MTSPLGPSIFHYFQSYIAKRNFATNTLLSPQLKVVSSNTLLINPSQQKLSSAVPNCIALSLILICFSAPSKSMFLLELLSILKEPPASLIGPNVCFSTFNCPTLGTLSLTTSWHTSNAIKTLLLNSSIRSMQN